MAEVTIGDVPGAENLPDVDLPELAPAPPPLRITIRPRPDDVVEEYLADRRAARLAASDAYKLAGAAGYDPAEITTGVREFDYVETRSDDQGIFTVGVHKDNPENNRVLTTEAVEPPDGTSVTEDVLDVGEGAIKGAVQGLAEAGMQIGDTLTLGWYSSELAPWMNQNIPYLAEMDEGIAQALKAQGTTQEVTASIVSPLAQVLAPGSLLNRTFRAAGVSSRILSEALGYGITEIAAVDPKDETLLEMGLQLMDDAPELQAILNKSLAAQEDENQFLERIKNAPRRFLEGGPIGIVFERLLQGLGMAYRGIKNSPRYRAWLDDQSGAVSTEVATAGLLPSQQNMRMAQMAFENDIRAGLITPNSPGVDPDEVRAIQANLGMEVTPAGAAGGSAPDAGDLRLGIDSSKIEKSAAKVPFTAADRAKVSELSTAAGTTPELVETELRRVKAMYPESDGWAPFNAVEAVVDTDGTVSLRLQEQAYQFNRPKGAAKAPNEADPKLVSKMAAKMVAEVKAVAARAAAGDKNAQTIMNAQTWYRVMRDRLRQEFGSFGDTFADVIGTTSAQTDVRQNWNNAVEVMRRFSRGEYDDTLAKFKVWMDGGGTIGSGKPGGSGYVDNHYRVRKEATPAAKAQAADEGLTGKEAAARAEELIFEAAQKEFPLITKGDNTTLFNTNSPATMSALLDLFRLKKAGDSPKTPNFTGNLIGYSSLATIDVWAARMLRRLSGQKRLVPGGEQGVSGTVNADGVTVGGEFGFGQKVFTEAAAALRKEGLDLGDDDLQAVAWFMEKEIWGKKGWTTRSGEGGSLEAEANFAGINDREGLDTARRQAETDPTAGQRRDIASELDDPAAAEVHSRNLARREEIAFVGSSTPAKARDRLMEETGATKEEAVAEVKALKAELAGINRDIKKREGLAPRLEKLETKKTEQTEEGRRFLAENAATVRRFTGGLSLDKQSRNATDGEMSAAQTRITDVAGGDDSVVMLKATPSQGRYIDPDGGVWDERTIDLEYISRQDHDPSDIIDQVVAEAKAADQESTFFSEVVEVGTEASNPGVEVYFRKTLSMSEAEQVTKVVNDLDLDVGFTFATDLRQKQRAAGGAATGDYVGIRMQYVPEFGGGAEGKADVMAKIADALDALIDLDYVSNAQQVGYSTRVWFRDKGDYDVHLGGKSGSRGRDTRSGQ
jgi:hypothetical protein